MNRKRTMKRGHSRAKSIAVSLIAVLAVGFSTTASVQKAIDLSDEQIENIVERKRGLTPFSYTRAHGHRLRRKNSTEHKDKEYKQ